MNRPGASGSTNNVPVASIAGQITAKREFLRSLGTGTVAGVPAWDTLLAADVPGDIAATRKFLRSLGTGAAVGTTVWDTLTAADIAPGTFGTGAYILPGSLRINSAGGGAFQIFAALGAPGYSVLDTTVNAGGKHWRVGNTGAGTGFSSWDLYNETDNVLAMTVTSAGDATFFGGFGCNTKAAQAAVASGGAAPAGGTGTAAGGWDTAAHRDAAITLLNTIRTALVNNGIMT